MGNTLGLGGSESSESYPYRVLMLGLDGAGKSTVLNHIKSDKSKSADQETVPTIGFNVESVEHAKQKFIVWDIGGQHKIRPLWRHYFTHTDAVIYVVDSSDSERITESKTELDHLLQEAELARCVVLILCNKCDMPYCMSTGELAEALNMDRAAMKRRQWFITPTIANKGIGLSEALGWLGDALKVNRGLLAETASIKAAAMASSAPKSNVLSLKDDPSLAKAKAAEALAQAAVLQDLATEVKSVLKQTSSAFKSDQALQPQHLVQKSTLAAAIVALPSPNSAVESVSAKKLE